jgi:transposase
MLPEALFFTSPPLDKQRNTGVTLPFRVSLVTYRERPRPTIPMRYSRRLYRQRNCIERLIGRLEINRAVATRYDRLADGFLGMLYVATAPLDQICPRDLG